VTIERTFSEGVSSERAATRPFARPFVTLRGDQSPTLLLLLALNLLLIVFFVVLNANATTDLSRSRDVLAGVQKSFGDDVVLPKGSDVTSVAKSQAQDALRTSVSTAFQSVLDGQDIIVRNEADRFSVIAPMAAFFEPETQALRASLPVLNRISAILKTPADGFRYEMIVTIDAGAIADHQLSQAGALAEDMLRRDFATGVFAVGLGATATNTVVFTFQVLTDDAVALDGGAQ
jgi:hypothetical protein